MKKIAVYNYHHKSYYKAGSGKVAVSNDHQELITKEEVEKLRHVMIIIKL